MGVMSDIRHNSNEDKKSMSVDQRAELSFALAQERDIDKAIADCLWIEAICRAENSSRSVGVFGTF
jgi:hypothetical protein